MRFFVIASFLLAACHDHDDAEPFPTFQECFDDHHIAEALTVQKAIVVCCLDHPIAGVKPACGADAAACNTYLTANLTTTSATAAEIMTSCTDYQTQKGM